MTLLLSVGINEYYYILLVSVNWYNFLEGSLAVVKNIQNIRKIMKLIKYDSMHNSKHLVIKIFIKMF